MPTAFREIALRPNEPAEVDVLPDGTVDVHWPGEGLTLFLTADEAQALVSELVGALLA